MAKKIDLKDVTFLIPVRIDSIDRIENLEMVLDYIFANCETQVNILEASANNNNYLSRLFPKVQKITFVEDYDTVFYRTKYINQLVFDSNTPIVAVWDADVLVTKAQFSGAVDLIRSREADFVIPYEKYAFDTTKIIRDLYFQTRDLNLFLNNKGKMQNMYPPVSVGGGFFADRQKYIDSGIENLNFYGWGLEDGERLHRWEILEYNVKRTSGDMYHLSHGRGLNSNFHSKHQVDVKQAEYIRIMSMTKKEMQYEVKSWNNKTIR